DQDLRVSTVWNDLEGDQGLLVRVLHDEGTVVPLELGIGREDVRVIKEDTGPGRAEGVREGPSRLDGILRDARTVAGVRELDTMPVNADRDRRVVGEMDDDLVVALHANERTRNDAVEGQGRRYDAALQERWRIHRHDERLEDIRIRF